MTNKNKPIVQENNFLKSLTSGVTNPLSFIELHYTLAKFHCYQPDLAYSHILLSQKDSANYYDRRKYIERDRLPPTISLSEAAQLAAYDIAITDSALADGMMDCFWAELKGNGDKIEVGQNTFSSTWLLNFRDHAPPSEKVFEKALNDTDEILSKFNTNEYALYYGLDKLLQLAASSEIKLYGLNNTDDFNWHQIPTEFFMLPLIPNFLSSSLLPTADFAHNSRTTHEIDLFAHLRFTPQRIGMFGKYINIRISSLEFLKHFKNKIDGTSTRSDNEQKTEAKRERYKFDLATKAIRDMYKFGEIPEGFTSDDINEIQNRVKVLSSNPKMGIGDRTIRDARKHLKQKQSDMEK